MDRDPLQVISPGEASLLAPSAARRSFRDGLAVPTAGWCAGYTQANLIAVPTALAPQLREFTSHNPAPCPLLDVTTAGAVGTSLAADADLRTDLPAYRIWRDGECVAEVPDATAYWRDDLVAFLIGCSFTFEAALIQAGVPIRHIEDGVNVPMYRTNRQCVPAGPFAGPLVVSMRPVPADLVTLAVDVTARYPAVHGAPVHVGDPMALGIADLAQPDFGDSVTIRPGEVPVFWACGVTPQAVVMASRPPFAISHAPGHMFITDVPDKRYLQT
jgi:uncharacterized protein YcsI (UPF0317 family)